MAKVVHTGTACCAFVVFTAIRAFAAPQGSPPRPLFTYFPGQMICAESSFVAMAAGVVPSELVVIRIGHMGIEGPRKLPVKYHDIYGMKCDYQRVELLVMEEGSDNFSRLPFTVREDMIQQESPIPIDYSISKKGPLPIEIQDFHKVQHLPLGDWHVPVPAIPRFNIIYELHFTRKEERVTKGLTTTLAVDLVDETADHKINKVVPLVRYERAEYGE